MATKLFVGNLPHSTTDTALGELVTSAGFQVASAFVARDRTTGTPRGFGFVELGNGEDVQRAVARLNGHSLEGRPLTVRARF
jgi:RNA recognition motif-containing protein